jgi:hypothetical protein
MGAPKHNTLIDFKPLTESGKMLVQFLKSRIKTDIALYNNRELIANVSTKAEHIERSYNNRKSVIIIDTLLDPAEAIHFFGNSILGSKCIINLEYEGTNESEVSEMIEGTLTRIVLKNISDINIGLSIEVIVKND